MIAPPNRPVFSARAIPAAASSTTDDERADPPEVQAALEARIAALVARASTPDDEALDRQRAEFDTIAREQAESDREINALRDIAMEQMKQDDELLKKWIALI